MNKPSSSLKFKLLLVLLILGGIIAFFLITFAVVFAGFFFLLTSLFQSTAPYQYSLETVQHHPAIIEKTGTPIEPGFIILGGLRETTISGNASMSYSVYGPKGRADIAFEAVKESSQWHYTSHRAKFPDGSVIELEKLIPPSNQLEHSPADDGE